MASVFDLGGLTLNGHVLQEGRRVRVTTPDGATDLTYNHARALQGDELACLPGLNARLQRARAGGAEELLLLIGEDDRHGQEISVAVLSSDPVSVEVLP